MFEKIFTILFRKKAIQQHNELAAVVCFIFAAMQLVSLISFSYSLPEKNVLGLFGYISAYCWYFLFGPISYLGVMYLFMISWNWWNKKFHSSLVVHSISYCGALFSLCMMMCLLTVLFPSMNQGWAELIGFSPSLYHTLIRQKALFLFPAAGLPMSAVYRDIPYINFETLFNVIGTALVASATLFVSLTLLFDIDIKALFATLFKRSNTPERTISTGITTPGRMQESMSETTTRRGQKNSDANVVPNPLPKEIQPSFRKSIDGQPVERNLKLPTPVQSLPAEDRPAATAAKKSLLSTSQDIPSDCKDYELPSIDLLNIPKKVDLSNLQKELKEKADLLEETLMSFGIEAKVGQIHCGPTVTMFEVHPAVGVKIGKIKTLENDIALNMEAKSIRIIAPIPGKAAVGIEVPNQCPQEVSFREILAAYKEQGTSYKIPMLLGKSVNGELVLTDLAKMPHCIIAGATGSGKSVCINSIVMSILMLAKPDEIRLLMIDPKKVELTPYTELPHMLAPVITEPHDAALSLNWLVREMEKRYEILKLTGQRNIDSFNKRKRNVDQEAALPFEIPEKLPYYVAIIDELADLMMVSSQDIETPIARIAQMARAVGIHLILATQRPSREVITGLIKANFPARIAFKVASRVNSQIILDDVGAETLLGYGDMLILLPGSSQLVRAQGVYVRDEEISGVINYITSKLGTRYIIKSFDKNEELVSSLMGGGNGSNSNESLDSLFEEAKSIVFSTGNASTTFLQRKLKIGYARAASIMDQLEEQGIVGPQEGAKPRRINFPKKQSEDEDTFDDSISSGREGFSTDERLSEISGQDDESDFSMKADNKDKLLSLRDRGSLSQLSQRASHQFDDDEANEDDERF